MGIYVQNPFPYQSIDLMTLRIGGARNKQEFKWTEENQGSASWTLDHYTMARIRVWAGGGGGGGVSSFSTICTGSGGGGAGGYGEIVLELAPGTYSITIGAKGNKGSGNTYATNGGASSFSTYITCDGGGAGGANQLNNKAPGVGGFAHLSTSAVYMYSQAVKGGDGGAGYEYRSGSSVYSEYGQIYGAGDSAGAGNEGGGGGGGYSNSICYGDARGMNGSLAPSGTAGLGGLGYGAGGGGGAISSGTGSADGGDGAPGLVVIEWF